jgi:hypothetical protein
VAVFPIDHVSPRSSGGTTLLDNLALACPRCNGHKWKHQDGVDPGSGEACRLFNPRGDDWAEHFQWSRTDLGVLEGRTAIGRATVARLQMNAEEQVAIRRLLGPLGVFPEVSGEA